MTTERMAIIGTAASWSMVPWDDPGLNLVSLNDAYRIKGFKRADGWYDFHPLDKFFHVPKGATQIHAHQVPAGYYVRPANHLEWLGAQTIPLWLHKDYLTQHPEAAKWRHAKAVPRDDVEAHFGRYFTSSPAIMIAHAILQGVRELHIYGIHLATEHEYIEQRPNFEFLCGRLLGKGKLTMTVKDGMRHYETPEGHLVLPEMSPVLQSDFRYAVDMRPRSLLEPLKWDQHRVNIKRERAIAQLKAAPWWMPTAKIKAELERIEAWQQDVQGQLSRHDAGRQWAGGSHA